MPLRRWEPSGLDTSPEARALKDLQNKLGRTPLYGACRTVTANTVVLDSDDVVLGDTTGGSLTVTLPPAATNLGRQFTALKTVAGNTLTLDGFGAETINGAATLAWTTRYASRTVQSDGAGWWVVASYL